MERRTVELHAAFSWICPDCMKRNFERAIAVEIEYGFDKEDGGELLRIPSEVTCEKCGENFMTTDYQP